MPLTEKSTLPQETWKKLEKIRNADIVVGVPSFNCAHTINYVAHQAAKGLEEYFTDLRSVILVSDGGSTDGTTAVVNAMKLPGKAKLVTTQYVGVAGKGTAVKAILEAVRFLGASSMVMVDSDLRSITSEWMKLLITPILEGTGLVTPLYLRHKYDGTITNFICYPCTCSLYGKRVRQPIGGDFGLSSELVKRLLMSPLWNTVYVSRFGIDIFITNTALGEDFPVKQALLGLKTHEAKDPSKQLASMFVEVLGSMISCMELFETTWKPIRGSQPVPVVGEKIELGSPEPIHVNPRKIVERHKAGFQSNKDIYRKVLSRDLLRELEKLQTQGKTNFLFPNEVWAKIVYSFAAVFKKEKNEEMQETLLEALRFIWIGRTASFILETWNLSSEEAEKKVQDEAEVFEKLKTYLLTIY